MVRVLGKGGKERLVPFNNSTATALRVYLKDREIARARSAAAHGGAEARRVAGATATRCS